MADDPTPDEIERVRAYEKRQRDEEWRRRSRERDAKIEAHERRFAEALVGETISGVEVDDFNEHGEVRGEREIKLTFASGRTLTISDQGWDERYWDVEIVDV